MAFGKVFETRAEAQKELKKLQEKSRFLDFDIRRLSKKAFPSKNRKKRFHVGTWIDFINWG